MTSPARLWLVVGSLELAFGAALAYGCAAGDEGRDGAGDEVAARDAVADVASDVAPDVAVRPELSACPRAPDSYYRATCAGFSSCEYGEECCCGSCHVSVVCDCSSGTFTCSSSDFCLSASSLCSPGCGRHEVMTPDGCATCDVAGPDADSDFDALAAQHAACEDDEDCVTRATPSCTSACVVAVAAREADAFDAAAWDFDVQRCGALAQVCNAHHADCTAVARCVDQRCVALDDCAADVADVGDPCDDGDPCTSESRCDASHRCRGVDASCDDANPCTTDRCTPLVGCEHVPAVADCAAAGSGCSLGGTCRAGVCETAVPGSTWLVDASAPRPGGVVVGADDDAFMVGSDTYADGRRGVLWSIDAAGAPREGVAITGLERAEDVRLLDDGDLLIAGGRFEISKLDLVVTRVSPQGVARWSWLVPGLDYDEGAMLARRDDHFAVVWQRGSGGEGGLMLALGDLTGSPPAVQELGATDLAPGSWPFERAAVAATSGGFIVLAIGEDRQTLRLTPVGSDGGLGAPLDLPFADDRRPRGVLALAAGDLLLWGPRGPDAPGWMRRIAANGALVWDRSGDVDVALLRDGELVVAAHDGQGPFVARHDLASGDELERFALPSTPGPTYAAVLAPAGLVIGGGDGTSAWLRRVTPWSACRDASCVPEGCVAPDDDAH